MKYTTIKEHHLYDKAFRRGARFSGKFVTVFVLRDYAAKRLMLANPEKKYYNRFGVSVSKKVGGAVKRSRAKRIIRAAYACYEESLKKGFLIVISAKPEIEGRNSREIAKELKYAFKKLEMFVQNLEEKTEAK